MKIKTLLSMITSAATLLACSEDDKVTYDSTNAQAPVLQTIAESIVLEKATSDNTSFDFQWQAAEFGFDASATYTLEMDIEGNDFANYQVLASTFNNTVSVTGKELNLAMVSLQIRHEFEFETPQSVQFRVRTTLTEGLEPLFSNIAKSNITAYQVKEISIPLKMYMIGSMTNSWDWNAAIEFTPVNINAKGEGKFWTIQYLDANAEFKFNYNKAWDGKDFCGTLTDETYATIAGNVKVTETGYYQIMIVASHVDETKQALKYSVTIQKPDVYLMGECTVDGWTEGVAASKFTVDDVNKKLISPALANSANLRMFVKFPGCDWWGSEFNVFDGKIELRGNDGDQAAVTANAEQVVTLDFTTMTGTIGKLAQ